MLLDVNAQQRSPSVLAAARQKEISFHILHKLKIVCAMQSAQSVCNMVHVINHTKHQYQDLH